MTSFQAISEYRLFACAKTAKDAAIDEFHINVLNGYGLAFLSTRFIV